MSLLDWWTGTDKEIERGKKLDAAIDAQNRKRVDSGAWTEDDYDQFLVNASANRADNYSSQVSDAFDQGWKEGRDNITGAIRGAVNDVAGGALRFTWDAIPAWLWLAAAAYVAFRLGLFKTKSA